MTKKPELGGCRHVSQYLDKKAKSGTICGVKWTVTGCWSLVAGFWSLVSGGWLPF
jgi:hypothetical protein